MASWYVTVTKYILHICKLTFNIRRERFKFELTNVEVNDSKSLNKEQALGNMPANQTGVCSGILF